jgi:sodium transport system permease protein
MPSSPLAEFRWILNKELTCCLRDSDVLIYGVFFPLLLYPLATIGTTEFLTWNKGMSELHRTKLAVLNTDTARGKILKDALLKEKTVQVVPSSNPDADLEQGAVDALVVPKKDSHEIEIRTSNSDQFVVNINENVDDAIRSARSEALMASLSAHKLPKDYAEPYHTSVQSLDGDRSKRALFRSFPKELTALLFLAINGAIAIQSLVVGGSAAICMLTLEREKKTLDTTLLLPVKRFKIILAKFISVMAASVSSGLINAIGLSTTIIVLLMVMMISTKMSSLDAVLRNGVFPPPLFIMKVLAVLVAVNMKLPGLFQALLGAPTLVNVLAIPFVHLAAIATTSAIYLAIAATCRSYKEAQVVLTIPMSLCLFMPFIVCIPGVEFNLSTSLIPIGGLFFLLKPGIPPLVPSIMAFALNIVLTIILLRVATMTMLQEDGAGFFERLLRSRTSRKESSAGVN